jgi:DNA-binding Lrp family transcriptional regulator
MTAELDALDRALIALLRTHPKMPEIEVARRLGAARGTVHARIGRLEERGVISGYGPDVDGPAAGYAVLAYTTLEITQGADDRIVEHLGSIPEVLEIHAVTGPGDLLCRIVARSNEHLHEVIQRMLSVAGISRTETHLALRTLLHRTEADLVARSGDRD